MATAAMLRSLSQSDHHVIVIDQENRSVDNLFRQQFSE